jgi:hypothetical protein
MDTEMIKQLVDVGGTLAALVACFWYIKFLTERHEVERKLWMDKDTESDKALRELLTDSNRILGDMKNVFNEHTLLLQQLLDRKIERSSNRQG